MFVRLSAAICGAGIVFLSSAVAMTRSEIRDVQSRTADRTAYGITIVGAASMYNPYRPGRGEGGVETASGERYDPSGWAAAIPDNDPTLQLGLIHQVKVTPLHGHDWIPGPIAQR